MDSRAYRGNDIEQAGMTLSKRKGVFNGRT